MKQTVTLIRNKETKGTTLFVNRESDVLQAVYVRKPYFVDAETITVVITDGLED